LREIEGGSEREGRKEGEEEIKRGEGEWGEERHKQEK